MGDVAEGMRRIRLLDLEAWSGLRYGALRSSRSICYGAGRDDFVPLGSSASWPRR